MNTTNTIIITLLLSFTMPLIYTRQATPLYLDSKQSNDTLWYEKGVDWLLASQSKDGGWGSGSFAYQTNNNFAEAIPDPATTAFVAMALLEAGGSLNTNPYRKEINKALEYIMQTINTRPENGAITSQTNTQPQRKLGMNIDASMALDFLVKIRSQMDDSVFMKKIDAAALICIDLLKGHQNPDGTFRNGGWAARLHDSNINASLSRANVFYPGADSIASTNIDSELRGLSSIDGGDINIRGSRTTASEYFTDGIRTTATGSLGIPLYDAVSIESETDKDATEVKMYLPEVVLVDYKVTLIEQDNTTQGGYTPVKSINDLAKAVNAKGVEMPRATELAEAYVVNMKAKEDLRQADIWKGFGNNGGEEFLSYKMHSESLEKSDLKEWKEWKKEVGPKFKATQNPNGSWSGLHCITSPAFCTAAVLLAWYGDPEPKERMVAVEH